LSNKTRAVLIILAGVVLVAIGVFASYLLIQSFQAGQAPLDEEIIVEEVITTEVVITTRDLFLGDRIAEGDVELTSVPIETPPAPPCLRPKTPWAGSSNPTSSRGRWCSLTTWPTRPIITRT
jgi:Flp pilus assembly protein CpaB